MLSPLVLSKWSFNHFASVGMIEPMNGGFFWSMSSICTFRPLVLHLISVCCCSSWDQNHLPYLFCAKILWCWVIIKTKIQYKYSTMKRWASVGQSSMFASWNKNFAVSAKQSQTALHRHVCMKMYNLVMVCNKFHISI